MTDPDHGLGAPTSKDFAQGKTTGDDVLLAAEANRWHQKDKQYHERVTQKETNRHEIAVREQGFEGLALKAVCVISVLFTAGVVYIAWHDGSQRGRLFDYGLYSISLFIGYLGGRPKR